MNSEYVRLSHDESVYGEASLLQSEINLLKITQNYNNYKEIRSQEFALKVQLKKSFDELGSALHDFDKSLPQTTLIEELQKKGEIKKEMEEISPFEVSKSAPQKTKVTMQLEQIKARLAQLKRA